MENTCNSGACIRVKKQIDVGAKLRVQWRREEFSGVARYCRKEGIDYLVGIQRDAKKSAVAKKVAAASVPARDGLKNGEWNVSVSPDENNDGMGSGPGETGKRPPEVTTVVTERIPAGEAGEGADFAGELLSMEDIYRAAGIVGPRSGYSINKVVQMLHSEHIRGLSKEMKRASVLMTLDAAGVSRDGEAKSFERADLKAS
jgi:hypothetical protein